MIATDQPHAREIARNLVDEIRNVEASLLDGYGVEAYGMALGVVAGRHHLNPAEYIPKLDILVHRSVT